MPAAISRADLDLLASASKNTELQKKSENLSITQLEVLRAVSCSIPVFAFVDDRVYNDHATYEKNKAKSIIGEIEFSSIEKPETAKYIFEFINYLRHRSVNNGITTYGKYADIEYSLRRQWSAIFQRLLSEQRMKSEGGRRIDALTEQFEDLKAAILTAIGSKNEKEVARGVVRFRKLIDFVRALRIPDSSYLVSETHSWEDFMATLGIVDVRDIDADRSRQAGLRPTQYLIRVDGTFYEIRSPFRVGDLKEDWEAFARLPPDVRLIIYETLSEMGGPCWAAFRSIRECSTGGMPNSAWRRWGVGARRQYE